MLVHGGWCGSWRWDEVAARLRLGGLTVYAAAARGSADGRYFELPCPLDAVHTMPAAVAGILETLATT
ncbi:MAG TPA: hypothetical protein VFK02_29040 [Kofleriaceae bacterium]|nr:hypothetical protein [Kofleriaceae bacterium]